MTELIILHSTMVLLVGAIMAVTPWLSRPDMEFAVLTTPEFRASEEATAIRRRYRIEVAIHTAIAVAWSLFVPPVIPLGFFWVLGGTFSAFMRARRGVLPHAAPPSLAREASLEPRRPRIPGGVLGQLGPFVLLAASGVTLWLNHEAIPSRFPIHWNLHGGADRWAANTPWAIAMPLVLGVVITALQSAIIVAVAHARRTSAAGAPAEREIRVRNALLKWLILIEYFTAAVLAGVALLPLRPHPDRMPGMLALEIPVIVIIAIGTLLIARAVRGTRQEAGAVAGGDGSLNEHWKAGLFYVNRDDAALFVEKRFGVGYTINFGNPKSWWLTAGFAVFTIGLIVISMTL